MEACAQSQVIPPEKGHKLKLSVTLLLAHAHVSQGIQNGSIKWLALPSWMLSYNRVINNRWAIGLHSDIIIEDFAVESKSRSSHANNVLERSYP